MKKIFESKLLKSKITSEDTTKSEQVLGYFLGPCLVYLVYCGIAGTYLTQFYTDVLGLSGDLLSMMPLVSKIISLIISLILGKLIDKTNTKEGKARPWILLSGLLMAICGILLYLVPIASYKIQIIWIIVSYNLFFDVAFLIYSLSHSLMVPLSTRNTKQRDNLAMLTSTGTSMIPGVLAVIIMPLLINKIGVGLEARNSWLLVMSILSIIAIPATIIEYYFTLERVTSSTTNNNKISFKKQVKACLKDKYWVLVILFTLVASIANSMTTNSMIYYCNWVLGNSIESGTSKQILVNMIGQAPMGFGVFILWPLVNKFGKRKVTIIGFIIAAIGSFVAFNNANNLVVLLISLFIKSLGAVPVYVTASLLADAQDHVELINGFRVDGFSASINSNIAPLVSGMAQTLVLIGINKFGYIVPEYTSQIVNQPESIRQFFNFCFVGIPMICYVICVIIMFFYNLDTNKKNNAV